MRRENGEFGFRHIEPTAVACNAIRTARRAVLLYLVEKPMGWAQTHGGKARGEWRVIVTGTEGQPRAYPGSSMHLQFRHLSHFDADQHGLVAEVNATADAVFDQNIKIKDRRLFVRDPDARTLLKNAVDQLKEMPRLVSLALEPVIVPRMDKLPVIVRIWPFEGPPGQEVRALLTLNALGPRQGPSAAILAKTFRLTPSEAKVACIIARGAPPDIAARELKISRETARNQLKSVFAKTDTHRQSELVALLLQVE